MPVAVRLTRDDLPLGWKSGTFRLHRGSVLVPCGDEFSAMEISEIVHNWRDYNSTPRNAICIAEQLLADGSLD